jgi:hypothetical protein
VTQSITWVTSLTEEGEKMRAAIWAVSHVWEQ